jgi:hypothetical protein
MKRCSRKKLKSWWNKQSSLNPDFCSLEFKFSNRFENTDRLERMFIFQYIPQSNIFIMDCNYSKMIRPAHFLNAEKPRYRVPE